MTRPFDRLRVAPLRPGGPAPSGVEGRPVRALVSGYYGFGNAGDEAILAGLVEGFRQLAPHVELTILSGDPAATTSEHAVAAVGRDLSGLPAKLRNCDLLISGGGGLLQDATSWRSPLYYLAVLRMARRAGVPIACIGHGIGPLGRWWVRRLTRRALSHVDVLAVRDSVSFEAVRALGIAHQVEVTADLAFVLPAATTADTDEAWRKSGLSPAVRATMGVALRRPPATTHSELAARLAASIGAACQQLGLRPVLVPMQHPRDVEFASDVASAMRTSAEIMRAHLTARELLALIAGFDLVVAMRLHALIFAAICGRPIVAISYDPKVDGLMAELGLEAATAVDEFDPEALVRGITAAWERRAEVGATLSARAASLRARARRNVELVLPLIGG